MCTLPVYGSLHGGGGASFERAEGTWPFKAVLELVGPKVGLQITLETGVQPGSQLEKEEVGRMDWPFPFPNGTAKDSPQPKLLSNKQSPCLRSVIH